ncbi:rhomboid family intramembrane serine protease [Streptomyces sp. NRRL WC-3742]|uniref:rhomboid family intramembrane serine protease n=1 Tax=Streptomyces sp. NRRL WC-3742 TaxID=1463934 RepID=UPI0004C80026|nr:rhomboid family intramembrane serine protease [Streptomyces sp. NRRL WC-3742]
MGPEDRPAASGPQAAPPGCYRHPGTATGVSCTRCERPICPQCMVSASVGFQCPECVGRGRAGARRATTRFGGVPVADGALVTRGLILANLLVWVLAAYVFTPQLERVWSLYSVGLHRGGPEGVADGPDQWYRLLTATFLHVEWWHIGANMLALLILGPALEEALGRLRFLALYLLAGLGGSTLAFLIDGDWMNSLGASGAIFGLIGATVVLQLRTKGPLGPVLALLVFNAIVTYTRRDVIDWRAHLGGLLLGALVAVGLMYAPRERRALVQGLTVAAAVAVEAGMLAIGTALYGG